MRSATVIAILVAFAPANLGGAAVAQEHPAMTDSGMGSGMMGRGMMGPGMMGPGMMGRPAPRQTTPEASGAEIFQKQCALCHVLRAGARSTVGPNLHGVFGRKSGSLTGYPYSAAMRSAGIVWDERTIDRFIAAPQSFVRGTTMAFPGIADEKTRRELIAYLKTAAR